MDDRSDLSTGDILDRLLADRLIDACQMTIESVTIVQGDKRYSFPHRKARAFLLGMLRGRARKEERDSVRAPSGLAPSEHAPSVRAPSERAPDDAPPPKPDDMTRKTGGASTYPLEPALNEMLRIASRMEIIKESKHDSETGAVTISLSACEIEMSESDALAFLAECILHEMDALRRMPPASPSAIPWDGGDGARAVVTGRRLD